MAQAHPGTKTHAFPRAVRRMARDGVVDLQRRRQELDTDELAELELQFQLPIQGEATTTAAWWTVDVEFDVSFYNAPEMRDSPLTMPHFYASAYIEGETDDATNPGGVFVQAMVTAWQLDDRRDAFTGATLAVGAFVPSGEPVEFSGFLHVTFQGYGALDENDVEIGDASDA